ncbi:hypothetical protein V6N13_128434 [Hibiscus sabdariffa]|uniref:Protein TILLER ANGLE CONTROL 1 n=1 Tax=Hibiscus sabdariffa TaxID=183260 RepID=A0ABR2P0T9_9ROSI
MCRLSRTSGSRCFEQAATRTRSIRLLGPPLTTLCPSHPVSSPNSKALTEKQNEDIQLGAEEVQSYQPQRTVFDLGKSFVFFPDGLSASVKKTDGIAIDTNTKALLEQVALVDMLDGILTIGTFGFDPLKPSSDELKHCLASEGDDEQGEEERFSNNSGVGDDGNDYSDGNDEENPLMFSTFDHDFEDMTMTVHGAAVWSTDDEIRTDLDSIEGHSGKLRRRRTTLADLFSEDSNSGMKKKHNSLESDSNSCGKGPVRTKQGLSFAKKLMPQAGEDSHPIKMINQMMKRMLKRKIHPELEGKGNKLNKQCSKKEHEASESVYLLQQSPGAATA